MLALLYDLLLNYFPSLSGNFFYLLPMINLCGLNEQSFLDEWVSTFWVRFFFSVWFFYTNVVFSMCSKKIIIYLKAYIAIKKKILAYLGYIVQPFLPETDVLCFDKMWWQWLLADTAHLRALSQGTWPWLEWFKTTEHPDVYFPGGRGEREC